MTVIETIITQHVKADGFEFIRVLYKSEDSEFVSWRFDQDIEIFGKSDLPVKRQKELEKQYSKLSP